MSLFAHEQNKHRISCAGHAAVIVQEGDMMDTATVAHLITSVHRHYPAVQAIYLFGSWGTAYMREDSDVDIALLLPHRCAKALKTLQMTPLHVDLEVLFGRDVDLINMRQVSTVFQKEIVLAERRVDCSNQYAADEFEMLTASYYQKLNEERTNIIADARQTGRFYHT